MNIEKWVGIFLMSAIGLVQAESTLHYVSLADGAVVKSDPVQHQAIKANDSIADAPTITVYPDRVIHASLSGIGGAFNEQGGEAFMRLPEKERTALANALFNPKTGSGFSLCRTAVGASDFGLGAYSYSETPDDYTMQHFSVERDTTSILPFIRAGLEQNPELRIFASPWSPPGWMKETGTMDAGAIRKKVGPEKKMKWVNNGKNYLRDDPEIFEAYALYFVKYVQAYAKEGVVIERLAIQNETDMNTTYPSCDMLPEQMVTLAFDYIQPAFKKAGVNTEIWAGTFRGQRNDAATFIALEGADKIDGIAMQYAPPQAVSEVVEKGFPVMHTEGNCFNAENSMEQARTRFKEIARWLNAGSENFCYWNMVLNEESKSGWDWPQNSLVRIDREAGSVIYNPDYLPVTLLSRYIRPSVQCLVAQGPMPTLAVQNETHIIVFLQNDKPEPMGVQICVGERTHAVALPANALCAVELARD
jgi:glucosylceramidase